MRWWLYNMRKEAGKTQSEYAKQLGLSQPYYYEIEVGNRTPRAMTAMKMASVLGVPWTRFFEEEE